MLSDEEKEAVEYWKTHMEILHWNTQLASEHYIKVLLDLIEKQSKEIEENKEIYQTGYVNGCVSKVYEINKKWEDKIKAKIEEVKDGTYDAKIVLQSLLEKE